MRMAPVPSMSEIPLILDALQAASGRAVALATLVEVEGSSYRSPGARLLLLPDGTRLGSISGGCLEQDIALRAQAVLASGRSEVVAYDTTVENDLVWGVGTGCQGVVRVFIERLPAERPRWVAALAGNLAARRGTALAVAHGGAHPPGTMLAAELAADSAAGVFRETIPAPPALLICGAGDDAQPLVRLAKETGWHVTVADSREAYATAARFPLADSLVVTPAARLAESWQADDRTFVVVMTHRYAEDLELLRVLLPLPLVYLGVLGPRQRTDRLLAALRRSGFESDAAGRARLHAPVGLDLGGRGPEWVAVSILAELQCRLFGRTPGHLCDRAGAIHA